MNTSNYIRLKLLALILVAVALVGTGAILMGPDESGVVLKSEMEGRPSLSLGQVVPSVERPLGMSRGGRGVGTWSAPVGRSMVFACDATVRIMLENTQANRTGEGGFALNGTMNVTIEGRRGGELMTKLSFPGTTVVSATGEEETSEAVEAMKAGLGMTTYVRLKNDGRTLGFLFPSGMNTETKKLVRSLVAAYRFVIPEDAQGEWRAKEVDATGLFSALYRAERSAEAAYDISKSKLSYEELDDLSQVAPTVTSTAKGRFDPGLGWVGSVSSSEVLELSDPEHYVRVKMHMEASCQLLSVSDEGVGKYREAPWDAQWASVSGADEKAADSHEQREDIYLIRGVTFEGLKAQITGLVNAEAFGSDEMIEARRVLEALVRLHPEVLAEIEALLRGGAVDATLAGFLLSAVGSADTQAGELLLAGLLGDPTLSEDLRMAAALSVSQISNPSAATVKNLQEAYSTSDPSSDIRNTTLLLMGALASRGGETGEAVLEDLLKRESAMKDTGELQTWLEALGNTGADQVLEPATRYLESEDPAVRSASVSALRTVETKEATAALSIVALSDSSASVRAAAAGYVAQRSTEMALRTTSALLASGPTAEVRQAIVQGLGEQVDNPAAAAMLKNIVASDADQGIRDQAAGFLNKQRGW